MPTGFRNALNCVKAAAALGAILWVLFCITVAFLVISFIKRTRNDTTTADVAAANGDGAGAEAKATELHGYNSNSTAPPGGASVDPAASYPVLPQQYQQQPYP